MKHICIDSRMLFCSGIGTYLKNLLLGFQKAPLYRFTLLLSKEQANTPYCAPFEKVFLEAPIYSLQEQWLLPKKIPSCDLFWTPHFNVPFLPIRAKKRVVTLHDTYHLAFPSSFSLPQRLYAKFFYYQAVKSSEKILTVSSFSKAQIQKYLRVAQEKITPIYLAVDRHLFQNRDSTSFFYDLPKKYLLYVGNLKPNKNVALLVKAFSQLTEKYPDLYLVIVTLSDKLLQQPLLKEAGENASKVLFFNRVSDRELPFFYQKAQAFIFPSYYEGFGIPPLEAMSCSCPVIACKAASIPEICKEAAIYFDLDKIDTLKEAIIQILSEEALRQKIRVAGEKRVAFFSWEKTVEQHLAVFEEILFKE